MALKMAGGYLVPAGSVGGDVTPPELDLDAQRTLIDRMTYEWKGGSIEAMPDKVMLAPKVLIGPVVTAPRDMSGGTIIPLFDERMPVETLPMERIAAYLPDSTYSPAPASIFGIGPALGTIVVTLGKAVVAEIAADVSMDTLQRIGQRVMKNARIRGRTVGNDIGRHVAVRDEDGRSGFMPFLKAPKYYTGPCEWYEFWCWLW